jgi:hemerythrin-like domain-containing protein
LTWINAPSLALRKLKQTVEGPMVSQALDELYAEHRCMSRLLDLLQGQVRLVGEDRQPDGELLLEIAEYFASFPDLFHHPKEDLILRRLIARAPADAEALQHLEDEHEEGGRELKRFMRAVIRLVLDPEADTDRFLSAALAFMDSERRHMAWEEESFFSVAEQALLPEDWAEIDARLKCFIEPLRKQGGQTGYKHINQVVGQWRSRLPITPSQSDGGPP